MLYKSRKRWDGTVGVLASSACSAASENCTLYIQESLQNTIQMEICNHDPMFTLHIAELRVDNSKSVIIKSWNLV